MEVKATIKVSDERIRDLIISGFESGGYGSFVIYAYDRPETFDRDPDTGWPHPDYPGYAYWPLVEGCAVLCIDKYERDDPPTLRLDRIAIERGFQLLADKYPRTLSDFLHENEDAYTGDAFLQCCLLGDVIYS